MWPAAGQWAQNGCCCWHHTQTHAEATLSSWYSQPGPLSSAPSSLNGISSLPAPETCPSPRHHRNLENSRWSTPQGPQSTHLLVISVLAKDKDHWGAREQSDYRQAQLLLDDLLCVGEGPYLVGESGEVKICTWGGSRAVFSPIQV